MFLVRICTCGLLQRVALSRLGVSLGLFTAFLFSGPSYCPAFVFQQTYWLRPSAGAEAMQAAVKARLTNLDAATFRRSESRLRVPSLGGASVPLRVPPFPPTIRVHQESS